MKQALPPTILTMGEPAGIGGEITLKAWASGHTTLSPFCIIDSPNRLQKLAGLLKLDIKIAEISQIQDATRLFKEALPVLPIKLLADCIPGQLNHLNSPVVISTIKKAVGLVQSGQAGAIVTNPIHKNALYRSGFAYPGHTEYLAALAEVETEPVMMLASERLRVIPITRHNSIQTAITILTTELIIETALIANDSLQRDFSIARPRISIAGLNPHAGEGGTIGNEEAKVIEPAIRELKARGLLVTGPHSPDILFHEAARKNYDVVLCMYHDQALIPIKTLDFDTAVNVTLGLPFIRTSPDHGTALDIAGTGNASEKSLISALKMANKMVQSRFIDSSL
jgi:4-hydroxythreonine-4-phosphate dehydrogenase